MIEWGNGCSATTGGLAADDTLRKIDGVCTCEGFFWSVTKAIEAKVEGTFYLDCFSAFRSFLHEKAWPTWYETSNPQLGIGRLDA